MCDLLFEANGHGKSGSHNPNLGPAQRQVHTNAQGSPQGRVVPAILHKNTARQCFLRHNNKGRNFVFSSSQSFWWIRKGSCKTENTRASCSFCVIGMVLCCRTETNCSFNCVLHSHYLKWFWRTRSRSVHEGKQFLLRIFLNNHSSFCLSGCLNYLHVCAWWSLTFLDRTCWHTQMFLLPAANESLHSISQQKVSIHKQTHLQKMISWFCRCGIFGKARVWGPYWAIRVQCGLSCSETMS